MKRISLTLLILIGIATIASAKKIDPETAKLIAQNMYQEISKNKASFELVYTSIFSTDAKTDNKTVATEVPLFYVFNSDNENGFVIVSGDDNTIPVLGYATKGSFDKSNLPPNFQKWLENYKNQIRYIITNDIHATEEIKTRWEKLINGQPISSNKNTKSVNPMLSVTWGQSPYVNDLCPYDVDAGSANGYHCVAGCPATAMAQIMKYWEYPNNGTGFHSYNHPDYGTLSANFGSTTYDWASMPNSISSANNAVATLMYHCGVAVEMNYGPTLSGSYIILDYTPTPEQCSEFAYKTYFGYDATTIQGLLRENYSDYAWKQLLKDDLDAGRPIQYAGFGEGGHTFVCDGYDNDYFHMNWGWSGYADGYFLLDALNPGSGGTGSGAGTYNDGQQALIGIQPLPGDISYDITLYEDIVADPNPVWFGSSFTVHTDVANWGTNTFNGDWTAALFDENYNFVDYIETLTSYSLANYSHYTNGLDFTTTGMTNALPGSYYIGIFYRPTGGDWILVGDDSYSNLIPFEVYYSNDIELYQDMIIDVGTTIEQHQSFTVTLDVLNDGSTTFYGDFSVDLYDLEGSFVETIQELTGAELEAGYYYDDLIFTTSGVSVSAGTYLMALTHLEDGGNWELSGSSYYQNPIYVTIIEPAIQPDIYEINNLENDAYNLSLNFGNNNASILTLGSNLHIGSDVDYYKIDLATGYDYTITARVHDSYNSGNGNTYTCDVSWTYKDGSSWSSSYDDVMSGDIVINNGGTVYFKISPYFMGETGTYLLDIDVSREIISKIENSVNTENLSIFPNPVSDYLSIETENNVKINSLEIVDILGKQVLKINNPSFEKNCFAVSVTELKQGTYMLLINTEEKIWKYKFVKSE